MRTGATFSEKCLAAVDLWRALPVGSDESVFLNLALECGLDADEARRLLCEYLSAHGERTTLTTTTT